MATTSQINVVRAAVHTLLDAALAVNVFKFIPGDDAYAGADAYEFVALGNVPNATQAHLTYGGSRTEQFTLEGIVWVMRLGAGDTLRDTTEARALVLLAAVETALRSQDEPGGVFHAEVASYGVESELEDRRVWTRIRFDLSIESHI